MPKIMRRKTRDLKKIHKVIQIKHPLFKKPSRRTLTNSGNYYERRRITVKAGNVLNNKGEIEGPASELFVNLGKEARGVGTRAKAHAVKHGKRYIARLIERYVDGEITKEDYRKLRDAYRRSTSQG